MSTPIVRRRKKPVDVDTIQWLGDNLDDVIDFTNGRFSRVDPDDGHFSPEFTAEVYDQLHDTWIGVKTGQHIVRGVKGELYPIAEDVLADTYDTVDEKFFVPGRTYTRTLQAGVRLRFECEHLTSDPKVADREACGWVLSSNGTRLKESLFDHDFPLWTPEAGDR